MKVSGAQKSLTENADLSLQALITGPEDTPYMNTPLIFDIFLRESRFLLDDESTHRWHATAQPTTTITAHRCAKSSPRTAAATG